MANPLQEPALETPPGVISQFPTTHSDEQAWFYVCATLSTVVPGILLLLRLYTKLRVVRKVDLTDYIIITAFLFFIALLSCARMCLAQGAGVHQWNLPMHNLIGVTYWLYVAQIIYAPTIFLVKTALLLQYIHLFAPQKTINRFMWYTARTIIVVTGIYYTISTFITIFACSPREAIWNPLITDPQCLDNNTVVLITCLFNIASDITILLLPARAVWKLRIPTRKKVGIVLLFAIGLLACIANAMIILYVTRIGQKNADVTYNTAGEGLWALAEISFGIIVTCTLSLPKFIEAEGTRIRGVFSSLTRPLSPLKSVGSFGSLMQSKETTASQEAALNRIMGPSERDLPLINHDPDLERYPSYEPVHKPEIDPKASATDTGNIATLPPHFQAFP